MLFPIPRMLFPLLLVYPFPVSEEDQEPLSESCLMKAVVISVSLRALPTASPIILAGFCCYSPSSRSPLPSPIQMPPAQATVPPLALPSRPLVGGHRCSLLLEAPTLLSAQPSVPLWEFPVSARPGAPDLMCILAPLLLSPTRPSGASSQTLPLPRGPGLLAPSHLLGGAPPLLPCEPPDHCPRVPLCFFSLRA